MQKIFSAENNYRELEQYLEEKQAKTVLLVCDGSFGFLKIGNFLADLDERKQIHLVKFSDFTPNPLYESVVKGVQVFKAENCDLILAVGGGSAMDVAKCIKLYSNGNPEKNYLEQEIVPNSIPLVAVPTTAGTGSEATRYAVIYYNGEKQSVTHESSIPEAVLLDESTLETLPEYQKKSTMLDAFCHAVESFWSVNSTEESRRYSETAIRLILENKDAYLTNTWVGNKNMLLAANIAGKAINITQTTAGHAMCYKLTSLYGIAHGHAAALCVSVLWPYMLEHTEDCIDPRGQEHLAIIFKALADAMGEACPKCAARKFQEMLDGLALGVPDIPEEHLERLKTSVNPVRLKNNPVQLTENVIEQLYRKIRRIPCAKKQSL